MPVRWDGKPEPSAEHVSPVFLYNELDTWLADPFTRQRCIDLWQDLGGPSYLAAYPDWEIPRVVRERLWRAFDSGELVAYKRGRPPFSAPAPKASQAPAKPAQESPRTRPPSTVAAPDVRPVHLRLHMGSDDAAGLQAKFQLASSDASFQQMKTPAADLIEGDGYLDLVFTDVPRDREYALEICPAGAKPYRLFENIPFLHLDAYHAQDVSTDEDLLEPERGETA